MRDALLKELSDMTDEQRALRLFRIMKAHTAESIDWLKCFVTYYPEVFATKVWDDSEGYRFEWASLFEAFEHYSTQGDNYWRQACRMVKPDLEKIQAGEADRAASSVPVASASTSLTASKSLAQSAVAEERASEAAASAAEDESKRLAEALRKGIDEQNIPVIERFLQNNPLLFLREVQCIETGETKTLLDIMRATDGDAEWQKYLDEFLMMIESKISKHFSGQEAIGVLGLHETRPSVVPLAEIRPKDRDMNRARALRTYILQRNVAKVREYFDKFTPVFKRVVDDGYGSKHTALDLLCAYSDDPEEWHTLCDQIKSSLDGQIEVYNATKSVAGLVSASGPAHAPVEVESGSAKEASKPSAAWLVASAAGLEAQENAAKAPRSAGLFESVQASSVPETTDITAEERARFLCEVIRSKNVDELKRYFHLFPMIFTVSNKAGETPISLLEKEDTSDGTEEWKRLCALIIMQLNKQINDYLLEEELAARVEARANQSQIDQWRCSVQ